MGNELAVFILGNEQNYLVVNLHCPAEPVESRLPSRAVFTYLLS